MKDKAFIVFSSCADETTARRLARALVEERLAACVTALPGAHSTYRWQGQVEEAAEIVLLAKTSAGQVANLCARLAELHPYEVAEVIALEAAGGSERYLHWIGQSTRGPDTAGDEDPEK